MMKVRCNTIGALSLSGSNSWMRTILILVMLVGTTVATPTTISTAAEGTTENRRRRQNYNRRFRQLQSGADAVTGDLPPLSPEFSIGEEERELKGLKKKKKKFSKKGWLFKGPKDKKWMKKMKKKGGYGFGLFGGPPHKKNKGGIAGLLNKGLKKGFKNGGLFNNGLGGPSSAYAGSYNAGYRPRPPLAAIISPIAIASVIGAFVAYKFCGCCKDRELRAEGAEQKASAMWNKMKTAVSGPKA